MNWLAKIMIKGHPDSSFKDWQNGIDIISKENNSPQSSAIYPIISSVDYRSLLLNTKKPFMKLRSGTFGIGMKNKGI